MSYEYKEMLKAAARDFLAGTLQQDSETEEYLNLGEVEEIYSDISIELDHVYAMAERVSKYLKDLDFLERNLNECLTKAEAFDSILKSYDESLSEGHMADEVINIIEKYESGEYDAKQ